MFDPDDDEKEGVKDSILEQLMGEVDDHAASQLPDEEGEKKPGSSPDGVEISIIVKPRGSAAEGGDEKPPEEEEDHDDIAHALGMHDGGCSY